MKDKCKNLECLKCGAKITYLKNLEISNCPCCGFTLRFQKNIEENKKELIKI